MLLQLRVGWSHHGGTWGTPGGALHPAESAADGALREAGGGAGAAPGRTWCSARSRSTTTGDWRYTTVLATPAGPLDAADLVLSDESAGV
ncbi:NUDIX hydrolase, partial [Modestobacter sp. VKM Ac-2676]